MGKNFQIEEVGFPDQPQVMLATIRALKHIGGSASLQELKEQAVAMEAISEDEQSIMMHNGRSRKLNYCLAWTRTYLKRGGALENSSRGVWALTEDGEAIDTIEQVRTIYKQVLDEHRQNSRQKRAAQKQNLVSTSNDDADEAGFLVDQEDSDWQDRLLGVLQGMDPSAFERLAQRLLREAGFTKVEVRGKSGDGGIDGVGVLRVNLVTFQVYFQCKRWKGSVGAKEIRDFRGALQGRSDKGLFITTGNFTSQSYEEATRDGAIAIDLIDGERLCDLFKQYDLGVRKEMIEKVTIIEDWFKRV